MAWSGSAVLRVVWGRWRALAHALGTFQASVLLSMFYFLVVPPFALIVQRFRDPLQLRERQRATYWTVRPTDEAVNPRRQF